MTDIDLGARCDRHVGDPHSSGRCSDCDQANRELAEERAEERHQRALARNAAALGLTGPLAPIGARRLEGGTSR